MKRILAKVRTRFAPAAQTAACAGLFFFTSSGLRATDLPPSLTLSLPIAENLATPAWLGHPQSPLGPFASLGLPLNTPDANAALLVTVYFTEKDNGFLRVIWTGALGTITLADNLYEGTTANQRSLLISPATLAGDGTLYFQTGGSNATTGLQRVKLEWLESRSNLVSASVKNALVTPERGTTVAASAVSGQPPKPENAGAWENDVVTVPISTEPVRIEQGVDFSVDLDQVPRIARLALKESGLPVQQRLVVWINEKRVGVVSLAVPDLNDAGYFLDDANGVNYVGWVDGSLAISKSALRAGTNTLQLASEDATGAATSPPVSVKGLSVQLNYQQPPTPAANLPTLHLSADTEPIPADNLVP